MSPQESEARLREAMREMGRRGALATNAKLTPAERKRAASKAATARWAKRKKKAA